MTDMMDTARLLELCEDFRHRGRDVDDDVVTWIGRDVERYKAAYYVEPVPELPPAPLAELLPLMGWLIYEASWNAVQQVQAAFEAMDEQEREQSARAYGYIRRLADAARGLVWPEFAPRALGAIRSQALAESKRDTEAGYDAAYIVHQEARDRYRSYCGTHGDLAGREDFLLALDEVLLQLALAETGTACRTAERVICRWSEDFAGAGTDDEERWVQRMYKQLFEAVEIGRRALDTARTIKDKHGLVHVVTLRRLALVTGYRNPGIMTARAALLALALCPAMEHLQRMPAAAATWEGERALLIEQVTHAYNAIQEPVSNADGTPMPMKRDHQRALVQLRLNLALLVPGHSLPSQDPFDPCLTPDPLDDEAVTGLSSWLLQHESGGGPNHGNIIGAATLPLFNQSVVALRSFTGNGPAYYPWRRRWYKLGRYSEQSGREARVEAALRVSEARPSLGVRTE
ncbi:hypothetical protein OHA72_28530 [Dactylosporangium sp. NBC_01737]|uniref:hypothetical protein n=1 Tax=Dactylosporangium sp. NBC_01737 TaxID=2975959 RepID=UPI002E11AE0E|nr:hypothetical protein OHA72_28530 [Dactylosporangium sp. NBC_01737]